MRVSESYPFDAASAGQEPTRWEGNRHIVRYGAGLWGFWCEANVEFFGPYQTPEEAHDAFGEYCRWLDSPNPEKEVPF